MQLIFPFTLAAFSFYGLTLAMVLFLKKTYLTKATRFLALLILIFSIILFQSAIFRTNILEIDFSTGLILGSIWYLISPLIFFHAYYSLYPNKRFTIFNVLHFIPLILHVLNILPFFLFMDGSQQTEWVASGQTRGDWFYTLMAGGYLIFIQYLIYLPWSLIEISRFIENNKNHISNQGLNRILFMRNGYGLLTFFIAMMEILRMLNVKGDWSSVFLVGIVSVIFYLAFISMNNPSILFDKIPFKWTFRSRELPKDEMELYSNALVEEMKNRVYRDPEITLDKVADIVKLQPRQLSNLIKRKFDKTFPEFINDFRISEARRLLEDPKHQHWSILAIGLEVGFNSKSTFNRVFKKTVGITPSEYLSQFKMLN
ncbi:MAG: helix-turn-helix transcriptional regulator [Bacteroidota bacterium]